MKPTKNHSYEIDKSHLSQLYSQEHLRHAPKNDKYNSLNGALQRMILEEALVTTEAMKLSQTHGDFARANEAEFFEKCTEFYAYQAEQNPRRFFERESEFMLVNITKKQQDDARGQRIIAHAKKIDAYHGRQTSSQLMAAFSTHEK